MLNIGLDSDLWDVLRPPFHTLTPGQNETRSTGSVGKGFDSQLCHYSELRTQERTGSSLPGGFIFVFMYLNIFILGKPITIFVFLVGVK